jgi:hypothetical protein
MWKLFLTQLCFAPDESPGGGEQPKDPPADDEKKPPAKDDTSKELLKELMTLRKERDKFKAESEKYRTQAHKGHRERLLSDLEDARYAKFVPDVEFDDDGKPTEKGQKVLDDFRSEFPDFFKSAADAEDKKNDVKNERKGVPPAGSGKKDQAFWDDMKKNNPKKWRQPDTQREYADWLSKRK